jgi:hypothetical protein
MGGITPSKLAMFILKINIFLFVITMGVNILTVFPYYMHLTQISGNIAMEVANRNYTTYDDLENYVGHLDAGYGESRANTYSLMTFNKNNIDSTDVGDTADVSNYVGLGNTSFSSPLDVEQHSFVITDGSESIASVNIEAISGTKDGKSLIACHGSCNGNFDPINNNQHMIDGMDGNGMSANSTLVNRGTPFKVSLKTRFKLSGGTFGFMFYAGIPITIETIGVTTQYYQYDSN